MQPFSVSGGFVLFEIFVCVNSGKREPSERVFLLTLHQFVLHAQQWVSNLLEGLSRETQFFFKAVVLPMGTELPIWWTWAWHGRACLGRMLCS